MRLAAGVLPRQGGADTDPVGVRTPLFEGVSGLPRTEPSWRPGHQKDSDPRLQGDPETGEATDTERHIWDVHDVDVADILGLEPSGPSVCRRQRGVALSSGESVKSARMAFIAARSASSSSVDIAAAVSVRSANTSSWVGAAAASDWLAARRSRR